MKTTFDEEDVVRRLHDSSTARDAFRQVVDHYGQQMYWQIRRLVVFHDDANDVLQNSFIKAWNSLPNFRGDSRLSTWLYKIAYNESISFLQKKKETLSIDDLDDNLAERLESDTYFDGDETQILLQRAISKLPDKQRTVFNMKYFQEMKYEDMSDILGTSVGALKASFHLAVKKIEQFFEEHD